MPVTDKASILYYTVIDLIALGHTMAEPRDQTRAGSELPGLLIPGLVPPLLGILAERRRHPNRGRPVRRARTQDQRPASVLRS